MNSTKEMFEIILNDCKDHKIIKPLDSHYDYDTTIGEYYDDEIEIIKHDLEMLEKNKDLLLELVSDRLASIKFTETACGGKPTLQEKLSKLIKLKEWLENGKSEK